MKKKSILLVLLSLMCVSCSSSLSLNSKKNIDATPVVKEETTQGSEENLSQTVKVKVHYARNDAKYDNWGIWAWQSKPNSTDGKMIMFDKSDGVYGNVAEVDLVNDERYAGATEIGFLVKTHSGSSLTTWTSGLRDISSDRFIEIPEKSPNGILDIYLYEGVNDVMHSLGEALKDKIVSSDFTSKNTIVSQVILSQNVTEITKDMFHVYENGTEISLKSFTYKDKKITAVLNKNADVTKSYSIKIDFPAGALSLDCGMSVFYDDQDFIDAFTYYGNDLGVTFNESRTKTTFKVWAPISSKVVLNIYEYGTPSSYDEYTRPLPWIEYSQDVPSRSYVMKKTQQGVWSITLPGNLHGKYYTYSVTNGATTNEVVDPYAKSCGVDGLRGQIVDFEQINDELDWDKVTRPDRITDPTDASIYEVHVRDVTIDETSGVTKENRGNFLGLSEKNTSYTKDGKTVSTGLASIKELGVTHIQLQPVYDYSSVDEVQETKYNWGYDPQNYNCLEGSYSSNPYDGLVRVKEFKTMMKSISEEGMLVNMDVVFNHTFSSSNTNFEMIVPGYYHRMNKDGTFSDGSGCGNEMASERAMYRKFVVDSCKFFVDEYNISGFRFDLMKLLDTTTMELVYTECKKSYDKVMVYGEPWSGGTSTDTYVGTDQSTMQGIKGVGGFNDHFRDAIRGGNDLSLGWVQDGSNYKDAIVQGIWGQFSSSLIDPTKTVNYVSCHDNYTLFDQIDLSSKKSKDSKIDQVEQAQAMVFFSEGISFIHGGEEFLRTKQSGTSSQVHNSYNAGDEVNKFDYARKIDNLNTYNFMKEAISIRNSFKGFRLASYSDISSALKVNKQDSVMDYTITYGGSTYRVVSNAGSSYLASGLSGYSLLLSNNASNFSGSSYSVKTNEIVVFKK